MSTDMLTYHPALPGSIIEDSAGHLAERFRKGLGRAIRAMQRARMREALSRLSDEQLAAIELARADIPTYAHRCIHGTTD